VDVQNDFMRPPEHGGRLYVKDLFAVADRGAVAAQPAIEAAVEWMRQNCDVLVYTGDWHGYDDEEIDPQAPDPRAGTYPPHCMGRSDDPAEREGAQIIGSIRPEDPFVLEPDASISEAEEVAHRAVRDERPVFIHKNRFNVFEGNPATEPFLAALSAELGERPVVYVVGVARDVCVTQAIDGMQERGYETVAIRDATWGLGLEPEEETLARWRRGGRVITLAELGSGSASA
jgi:nicotinamidase-related amidase